MMWQFSEGIHRGKRKTSKFLAHKSRGGWFQGEGSDQLCPKCLKAQVNRGLKMSMRFITRTPEAKWGECRRHISLEQVEGEWVGRKQSQYRKLYIHTYSSVCYRDWVIFKMFTAGVVQTPSAISPIKYSVKYMVLTIVSVNVWMEYFRVRQDLLRSTLWWM